MQSAELQQRTKQFGIDVIRLIRELPRDPVADVMSKQLLRAGTSVGANYRAACRAKSRADFISKMGIVEEEADETRYWIELLLEIKIVSQQRVQHLIQECDAIIAMTVSSITTARRNRNK